MTGHVPYDIPIVPESSESSVDIPLDEVQQSSSLSSNQSLCSSSSSSRTEGPPEGDRAERRMSVGEEREAAAAFGALPKEAENEEVAAPILSAGLVNEGSTCYLNSLLQLLFHYGFFREAVYRIPADGDDTCSIPRALQEIFFRMQERTTPARTTKLTDAFGWGETELHTQHDIQELSALLRDQLEKQMKGTVTEGLINQLFEGSGDQFVVTLDGSYTSHKIDTYYDIHLPLNSYSTLMDSLRSLTAKDQLVGDNKYLVEEEGKKPVYKDAEKGYEFRRFPPVILFHLKRFEMDLLSPEFETKKINSRFDFPVVLDLREMEKGPSNENEEEKGTEGAPSTTIATDTTNGNNNAHADTEKSEGSIPNENENEEVTKNDGSNEQPFSKDSPALYDLHGVIVHRGSVRSGHYYCYIREWDPVTSTFVRWIRFDDDRVEAVSEETAVSNNFGGSTMRRGAQCRSVVVPVVHNAYILSYVRRADCSTVLAPPPTDIVHQQVKEAILRDIREEERRAEEENERRRRVTLCVVSDDLIRDHVALKQYDITPRDLRFAPSMTFEVQKNDSVRNVYDIIANHLDIRRAGLSASQLRLWRSLNGRQFRPAVPFPTRDDPAADRAIVNYIDASDEWTEVVYLYLQVATKPLPSSPTDATSLAKASHKGWPDDLSGQIILRECVALDAVSLFVHVLGGIHLHGYVKMSLIFMPIPGMAATREYDGRFETYDTALVQIPVNAERCPVQEVRYTVRTAPVAAAVRVQDVRLQAPAEVLAALQTNSNDAQGVIQLPPADDSHILLFFKYYNCVSGRIAYAGSAAVRVSMSIAECADVLRHLLGEGAVKEDIRLYEERRGCPTRLLRNEDNIILARLGSGCLLIGQREHSLMVCRHPYVAGYLRGLAHKVSVEMIHISFPAIFNLLKSTRTLHHTSSSFSPSSSPSHSSSSPCAESSALVCVELYVHSPTSEKAPGYCDTDAMDDARSRSFYPLCTFSHLGTYRRLMHVQWDYGMICEAIGSMSGHDANYIRLHQCSTLGVPEVDPVISSPRTILSDFFHDGQREQKTVLFFEVLKKSRRVLESYPRVIVTVRSERNEALYMEKLLLKKVITLGELALGVLRRCAAALANCAVDPHEVRNDHTHSKDEQETISTATTTPFQVGSHCLALLLDFHARVIKDIVEIPLESTINTNATRASSSLYSLSSMTPISEPTADPYVIDLVLAQPLEEDQFRVACCHGEYTNDATIIGQPHLFGHPFVVTLETSSTITDARKVLLAHTGVPASELDPVWHGVMMYTDVVRCFSRFDIPLLQYWKTAENRSNRVPSLLLNHRRPREKPGSKYVVQNNPTLRLSKK